MKEELKANLITKYICGLCSKNEVEYVENWLKSNSANQLFLGFIKQNLQNQNNAFAVK